MPLLRATAEMLSTDRLERGVIETLIERDDTLQMLPFMLLNNKSYTYIREASPSGAAFLSPYDPVPESAADFTEVTTHLRAIAGQVDVDNFLRSTMGDTNDQKAIQIAAKVKEVGKMFHRALATGDVAQNAKGFDGLPKLVDPAYSFSAGANGAAVSLSMLDQLKDMVVLGADVLIMRRGTWRAIKGLLRAAGGSRPDMVMMENFGYPIPAFDGVPVLMNDYLAGDETQGSSSATCSIYAARFNEADGLVGLAGGEAAGIVVEDLGNLEAIDATRTRVKWYVGLALKSQRSLARLSGVTSV